MWQSKFVLALTKKSRESDDYSIFKLPKPWFFLIFDDFSWFPHPKVILDPQILEKIEFSKKNHFPKKIWFSFFFQKMGKKSKKNKNVIWFDLALIVNEINAIFCDFPWFSLIFHDFSMLSHFFFEISMTVGQKKSIFFLKSVSESFFLSFFSFFELIWRLFNFQIVNSW